MTYGMQNPKVNRITPLTGDSVQILSTLGNQLLVIEPAGSIASLTLAFPITPVEGQLLAICFIQTITSVTLTGTIDKLITSALAGDVVIYSYDSVNSVWMRLFNSMTSELNNIPRMWLGKTRKTLVKEVSISGTVTGGAGVVTFDLTDVANAAIFANVYKESANLWIDSGISYNYSNYTLASDKKSLTIKVTNPIISALIIVYANAANGTVVNLTIKGD